MPLPVAQLPTLKNDIAADGTLNSQPQTPDSADAIAQVYNLVASPDFWVWRTRVTKEEYTTNVSVDGTTFAWTGSGFITRSQGERDAWNAMFSGDGTVNPSLANVRQAFQDIFSGGTAPAPANRTHLATMSRRKATRGEKLFATGTGSTASPAVLTFEGNLTFDDVQQARALP
jgi:hypothetical protein